MSWRAARVPGTAAGALTDAGEWRPGDPSDLDEQDWWFRTRFEAETAARGEEVVLALDGIATVCEVYLNGELVLESDSMFARHALDIGARLRPENELAIRCLALAPLLRTRRRPRARWRTRLVAEGNLRFLRTMLLGRAPGFAPGPAAVGPWRSVRLERRRRLVLDELRLRPRVAGSDGVLGIQASIRTLQGTGPSWVEIDLSPAHGEAAQGEHSLRARLTILSESTEGEIASEPVGDGQVSTGMITVCGELVVPNVARWWPHTHGDPNLYEARLRVGYEGEPDCIGIDAGRVGFRTLAPGPNVEHKVLDEGLDLHINGVRMFARGAVWTPLDAIGLAPTDSELRDVLEHVRDAGMNMLRIAGTGAYETGAFYDLCDELGILLWQDFMFANFDYPIADEAFRATVEHEARQVLGDLAGRPSLAVLCGNSEVEQQVAMLGLDPALGRGELFGELLPALVRAAESDAIYLPSAPCGGVLPFRPDCGVANYYGVGGYRRPLEDARRAEVRFASECLAFANVPDEAVVEELAPGSPTIVAVHDPRWKAGVPRDVGSGWDFDDVRDHYLHLLFGVDPGEMRSVNQERYLELSRAVSGETMAEVFGEWRRADSPCGGGIVLGLKDLVPGAGWGVLDHRGYPKVAYHHLRRALAPVAVWTTDEGLGGIAIHVANDRSTPLTSRLRVALYRDLEQRVDEVVEEIELAPNSVQRRDVEGLLGHFLDAAWAYRFGPPAQNLIVVTLEQIHEEGSAMLSQCFRFPVRRPILTESASRLGLTVSAQVPTEDVVCLSIHARRLAYGVRVHVPGFVPEDDAFSIEPGTERSLVLRADEPGLGFTGGALSALNLEGRVGIALEEPPFAIGGNI